ncbi:hypothetical protein BMF94_2633 [Rhodotorula taiwanensis]|uniref:Uncharacterized protein n=1 Tax=Rhodotorula taiwanensis TaxID=741276 RepID=A0A2S5BCD1_9BASI|nr:hypothetical protein BMF94_2633 [Rhodotorula taiwanensis]
MQSSRQALQATARAAAPRRRVRSAPAAVPPSRDLVGPPCPLSNLRPVYYAPLFPSLHSPSGWGDLATLSPPTGEGAAIVTSSSSASNGASVPRRSHPYSLAEFPTLASTAALSGGAKEDRALAARLLRLDRLRRTLHAEDLEWRWARYRFDAFNQAFWTKMNERFLRARDAYIARREREGELAGLAGRTTLRGERDLGNEAFPPRASASVSSPGGAPAANSSSRDAGAATEDVDLAPFYAEHLAETKRAYADYNKQLWRMQAGLIWPAVKASLRSWRWKWEVWRAGVGGGGAKEGVAGY